MNQASRAAHNVLLAFGIDIPKAVRSARGLQAYFSDLRKLKRQARQSSLPFDFGRAYPCLEDRFLETGTASGHYFHQDLLVARKIFVANPQTHIDVGSRFDGFVAHVAAFRPIKVLDIRPLHASTPQIEFVQADLMADLSSEMVASCDSLSCLHALEHFGLGRYGDPVRYDGHLVGLNNLHAILKTGGVLYLSVPIGPQRIEFNAHRVFALTYLLGLFEGRYSLLSFSYVDDAGDLHPDVELSNTTAQSNFGCNYGCGIFELRKL